MAKHGEPGYVYLAKRADIESAVKIGNTKNIKNRMDNLRRETGAEHQVFYKNRVENAFRQEEKLRTAFNVFRREDIRQNSGTKAVEYFDVDWRTVESAIPEIGRMKPDCAYEKINGSYSAFMEILDNYAGEKTCVWDIDTPEVVQKMKTAKEGAEINARDDRGKTALIKAAKWANAEIVRFLLDNGADINQKCAYGWTALDYAKLRNFGVKYADKDKWAERIAQISGIADVLENWRKNSEKSH